MQATQVTKNILESVDLPKYLIFMATLEEADGEVAICVFNLFLYVEMLLCIWLKL